MKFFFHTVIVSIFIVLVTLSGCLGGDDEEEIEGISSNSNRLLASFEIEGMQGEYELVVVTAMDPTSKGRSTLWKYAYNDVTSSVALRSIQITVDHEGEFSKEINDPLQKHRILNWTIDSTTAYSNAIDALKEEGIITSSTKVKTIYLYLLGNDLLNHGCAWTIGMVLGSEKPVETTVIIDGKTGETLKLLNPKDQ